MEQLPRSAILKALPRLSAIDALSSLMLAQERSPVYQTPTYIAANGMQSDPRTCPAMMHPSSGSVACPTSTVEQPKSRSFLQQFVLLELRQLPTDPPVFHGHPPPSFCI